MVRAPQQQPQRRSWGTVAPAPEAEGARRPRSCRPSGASGQGSTPTPRRTAVCQQQQGTATTAPRPTPPRSCTRTGFWLVARGGAGLALTAPPRAHRSPGAPPAPAGPLHEEARRGGGALDLLLGRGGRRATTPPPDPGGSPPEAPPHEGGTAWGTLLQRRTRRALLRTSLR